MRTAQARPSRRPTRARRRTSSWRRRGKLAFYIVCFPIGFYVLWSRACTWSRAMKCGVSAAGVALLIAIFILLPEVPDAAPSGGVLLVDAEPRAEVLAPLAPNDLPTNYQGAYGALRTSTLIAEPTATPVPVYVYCNDNGLYYHLKGCRYVYDKTPHVTLYSALIGGKSACPDCKPPKELYTAPTH